MLGLLIEDVTLIKQREITAAVRFRGGATTTRTLPRPLTPQQRRATHEPVRRQIDALLDEYTDAQVARILNEQGKRTNAGDSFSNVSVKWIRYSAEIMGLKERWLDAGRLTVKQTSARLGLGRTAIGRLRVKGKLQGRICNDHGQRNFGNGQAWQQSPGRRSRSGRSPGWKRFRQSPIRAAQAVCSAPSGLMPSRSLNPGFRLCRRSYDQQLRNFRESGCNICKKLDAISSLLLYFDIHRIGLCRVRKSC
ncbi:MAG: hypothetical protein JXA73_19975 [Acidobacteria bacterium]|nr:hypothetical protein [Acidobacteriota bacterium]